MARHTVIPLSSDVIGFAEIISSRSNPIDSDEQAPDPVLFQTDRMQRLSTPWPVSLTRAEQLADCRIGKGIILDPACGSGSQLFAYCQELNRPGLGIELDEDAAVLSAANGRVISQLSNGDWAPETFVLVGDGTEASAALDELGLSGQVIAALHVDPARPQDAQNHALNEMEPPIGELLQKWEKHLVIGNQGPAIIIDLSPRLLPEQQAEVEKLLNNLWPSSPITWEWVSTGRGRIDRLTIWFGSAAVAGTPARMLRLLPDGSVISFAGSRSKVKQDRAAYPKSGDWLTIVDSALLSSGLQGQWVREALPAESSRSWVRIDGRRPMLLSSEPLDMNKSLVKAFVSSTGEVISRLKVEPTLDNLSPILVSANYAYLSRLTLRCKMNPATQPKLQAQLDSGLKDYPRGKQGFLADVETKEGNAWFICREP
ncbi:MAG: hypothetical protein CMA77_05875 [Euryarchaeota archaeon]|nr:hypothetical protein [Euryarchaeota archaeon]|tara:strand:- start:1573 stop:2856 length:1284 start_codon:yes stop_codon:yes gene_type:complete